MPLPARPPKRLPLRNLDPETRRARLIAARRYPWQSICRLAILGGHWDGGDVVRREMER